MIFQLLENLKTYLKRNKFSSTENGGPITAEKSNGLRIYRSKFYAPGIDYDVRSQPYSSLKILNLIFRENLGYL
jgi:hypothetical protein